MEEDLRYRVSTSRRNLLVQYYCIPQDLQSVVRTRLHVGKPFVPLKTPQLCVKVSWPQLSGDKIEGRTVNLLFRSVPFAFSFDSERNFHYADTVGSEASLVPRVNESTDVFLPVLELATGTKLTGVKFRVLLHHQPYGGHEGVNRCYNGLSLLIGSQVLELPSGSWTPSCKQRGYQQNTKSLPTYLPVKSLPR